MGCATTTVKVALIVFNVLLGILGFGAIGWIAFNPEALREELAITAYIACSLIVLFSFLGIFAALRESICLTSLSAVFLFILASLQILALGLDMGNVDGRTGVSVANKAWDEGKMDQLQSFYKCCGKSSAQDYVLLKKEIPASCYLDQDKERNENLYLEGCTAKLQGYYDDEAVRFNIVSCVLITFEIVGFLLAVFLVISFRNTQRRMQF